MVVKMCVDTFGKNGAIMDLLQEAEEILREGMSNGKLEAFFLVDGGFEGRFTITLKDIKIDKSKGKLIIRADGLNGEAKIEIKFDKV